MDEDGAIIAVKTFNYHYKSTFLNIYQLLNSIYGFQLITIVVRLFNNKLTPSYFFFITDQSNGDLENDERIGGIIMKMLKMAQKQDMGISEDKEGFQRLTSNFHYTPHIQIFSLTSLFQLIIQITVIQSAFLTDVFTLPRDLFLHLLKQKLRCLLFSFSIIDFEWSC